MATHATSTNTGISMASFSSSERFPKSLQVWIIFAKFTAIYPEESQQLSFIIHGMMKNRMKGSFAKHTILQIMAIIKQREPNLIPELKKKLNYIGKHVSSCKAKVRYIWELVLQGNVNEMEGMIIKANKSIKSTNSEFQELIGKFPNNRFVARAYVRFLRDVVADHQKSSEWASKCNLLHKGLPVTPDNAHELGVLAFPNLPKEQKAIRHQATFNNNFTEDTLTQEIDENEESVAADQEIKLSLKENIQSLQIPAYTLIRALHLGSLACLFILPMILVSIFAPIYIDSVSSVIPHLYSLTKIRSVLFQGMGVMARYVNENMPETRYPDGHKFAGKLLFPCPTYEEYFVPQLKEPEQAGAGWGSTFDSRGQLVSIAQAVASLMGLIDPIKHYKIGNEAMDNVRKNLFDKIHWVTFIDDLKYTDYWTIFSDNMSHLIITELHEKTSFDKIISHYMTYYSELLNLEKIPHDAYNKHYLMNTLNNLENVTSTVTDTVALMLEYIHSLNSEIQKITSIAEILFIIVVIIWYLFVCCYTIIKLSKDKIMIYKCLTSLQKSVISKVTDQFRILKKDDEEMRSTRSKDEELSRQEENLLKLFSTSSDSGNSHSIDNLFTIVIAIFVCAVHLVFSTQVIGKFSVVGTNVEITAPHIEHGQASFAFDWESVVLLQLLPGAVFPSVNFEIAGFTTETILYYINFWQVKAQKEFSILKYGDPEKSITSFATIGVNIDSNLNTHDYCNDSDYSPPTNYHDIYDCMSAEVALAFSENIVVRLSNVYTSTDNNLIYDGDDEDLTNLFHLMQHHVFDRFFYGLFRTMSDTVVASLQKEVPAVNKIGYSIVIVAIILEIFYMFIVSASENNQRYALSLLLMCPTKLVLNNQHIISILSGNFSSKNHDSTTRGAEFYDALVEEMPDSVIIMNQNGIITTVNKASTSLFEINKEDLLGQSIRKLGEIFNEENPFTHVFDSVEDLKNKTGFSKSLSFKKENQNYHVNLTLNILPDAIFLTCRDVTQEVMYNKLIQDEKNRSDSLLASILPARLVSRVAAGEKNISFAVQSATIIFIDIVSFTPWCGSTPADKVMRTLNLMFKYFDYSTSQHPTMTKCKCIGDCYMAAGGIFADVNQPATHAKDVVEFGLEALDNIDKLNQEINENLRIRVGINTGGPIVAGVLGTEKPTFEILDPTINMAQQMEHHGVPMKVHISRAVYELIYGSNFIIKERGQIEVKNGNVVTYLVERGSQK
ncbi:Adenylate and Guanylate cyclase catalytic domain containing protein [Tritrichomonas foetus]|uniref:Adenylate and Guanylate cyclase catalytic domain containing protein n=1 Tax=Tritrichomonas foetus TaxID=1144522 RepID=A0A1J4JD24_9EUKA|nr:Adenylate and Guanylate cyclase catalytic domain containing protein [Tritrichomonas foetus]|eukprot:OHS97016.1 Adenylate and Guanylate cyclase catalytic domain containing protein [Tritrichomonas foetus]